jgi:MSHA biogenesis protein MshL
MKTNHLWRNATHLGLGLFTGLCILSTGPGLRAQDQVPTPAPAPNPTPPPANQAEEAAKGKTLYAFQATDLDLKAALATFARANNLNIVPDNDVSGSVTVDLRDLPLEQVMRALLEAADCTWKEEGGLIRVRNTETRTFPVDYLRLLRKGVGTSSALLASGSSGGGMGGGMGGGGGGMGGGGGGGMGGGSGGGSGGSGQGAIGYGSSSVNLSADNPVDFWKELKTELTSLLTEQGKQTLAMNMTAGLVQVTDRPSALKKVESYLKGVDINVHRQVDIDVCIYSVSLNNQFQFGIDWVHVAEAYGGMLGFGGSTLPVANGGQELQGSALGGLNRNIGSIIPGGNTATLVFTNFNTRAAVNALESQGKVEVISKPRVRALNNQTAMIKVGEDMPFFNTSTIVQQSGTLQPLTSENTIVTSITIGTILSLTPQISDDDWISLDISPVLTSLKAVVNAPSPNGGSAGSGGATGENTSGTTAPDLLTKQASSLVRVRDGTTVVLGGLIQTSMAKNRTKIPILGDIPLVGVLFRGTFDAKTRDELVIFVTPHILREYETSARLPSEQGRNAIRLVEPR